jgi:hypothetical protein
MAPKSVEMILAQGEGHVNVEVWGGWDEDTDHRHGVFFLRSLIDEKRAGMLAFRPLGIRLLF